MTAGPPVVVLGAGFAGLVAARELRRNHVDVRVFEGAHQIAGMAATTVDPDGFSYDLGGHFITNRLAAALGAAGSCRVVARYGESVHLDGRYYGYPTGLLRVPRFVRSAALEHLKTPRQADGPVSAAEWFRHEFGVALADEVALPLLSKWSGAPAEELAASVGDKIPAGIGQTVFLRAAGRLTHRAVAIGYCRARPQSSAVFHVYPERGVGWLCQHVADEIADAITVEAPVDRIYVDEGRAVGVRVGGVDVEARAVISTAPINQLPDLIQGSDVLASYRRFRFRPLVLVNLKMEGRGLLPDTMVWVPKGGPFFRLTEAPRSMPWLAPEGKTMVLAEVGAKVGDEYWTMNDEDITQRVVDSLGAFIPDASNRLIGSRVQRTPISYPVFLREYEDDRKRLTAGTGIDGLFSIGRNGEFAHILMEDIYWRTLDRVQEHLCQLDDSRGHHRASVGPRPAA